MVLVHGSRSWFSFMVLVHGSRSKFSFMVLVAVRPSAPASTSARSERRLIAGLHLAAHPAAAAAAVRSQLVPPHQIAASAHFTHTHCSSSSRSQVVPSSRAAGTGRFFAMDVSIFMCISFLGFAYCVARLLGFVPSR
jgi:hypothetical protein